MSTRGGRQSRVHAGLSDEQLVERVFGRGVLRQLAFSVLANRYRDAVVRRCRYRLGNLDDAQDVAQEVLLRVYRGLENFRGQASFRTWLSAIVENECLSSASRRGRHVLSDHLRSLIELHEAQGRSAQRHDPALAASMRKALSGVAEPGRQVLYLRFYQERPLVEIADVLGISLSAAKMRLYRGLEQLRVCYRGELDALS